LTIQSMRELVQPQRDGELPLRDRRYVIVGSGAAGAILTARLSEEEENHVVLLEAGPDFPDARRMPDDIKYAWGTPAGIIFIHRSDRDWLYVAAATSQNTRSPLPRGRVIGGSTSINSCVFLRGGFRCSSRVAQREAKVESGSRPSG